MESLRNQFSDEQGNESMQTVLIMAFGALVMLGMNSLLRQVSPTIQDYIRAAVTGESISQTYDSPNPTLGNPTDVGLVRVADGQESPAAVRGSAVDFFISQGWTPAQAAGIVANLVAESNLNPSTTGDKGQAYGIAQWWPDRQREFERVIGTPIRQSTITEQLRFVHHELSEGRERGAGDALRRTSTAREAGEIVARRYERPKKPNEKAPLRARSAEQIYNETLERRGI